MSPPLVPCSTASCITVTCSSAARGVGAPRRLRANDLLTDWWAATRGPAIRLGLSLRVTMNAPSVQAELTLLAGLEHPRWPNRARYMPHIVIGDPQQREARMRGNTITERYLGVLVADAPDEMMPV